MLDVDVIAARLEPRQERGKTAGGNEPVHGGEREEYDAEYPGDQRQRLCHGVGVAEHRGAAESAAYSLSPRMSTIEAAFR